MEKGNLKCPLCYAKIDPRELKNCQVVINRIPKENEIIEFHLVTRQKNSIILQDEALRKKGVEPHLFIMGTIPLSRIVLTYDITPIVEQEEKKLREALELAIEFERRLLAKFIEEALNELEQKQKNFQDLFSKQQPGTF